MSWIIIKPSEPVNGDGILYLQTAHLFLQEGLAVTIAHFHWPFYSVLVALLSQALGASLTTVAFSLNAFFMLAVTLGFYQVMRSLSSEPRVWIWGGLCILSLHPLVHRQFFLVRDYGYYACYIWGLVFLIRHALRPQILSGLAWGVAMGLATLFRIEGALFLLFAPLGLVFIGQKTAAEKLKMLFQAYLFVMIAGGIIAFLEPQYLGRLPALWIRNRNWLHIAGDQFQQRILLIQKYLLYKDGAPSGTAAFCGLVFGVYIDVFVRTVTPFFLLLFGVSFWKRLFPKGTAAGRLIMTFVALNFAITWVFLLQTYFLVDRYVMGLAIVLLFWTPFALEHWYQRWRNRAGLNWRARWFFPAACACLLVLFISNIGHFGYYKGYIKTAGDWTWEQLPREGRVCTNSQQFGFYARPLQASNKAVVFEDVEQTLQQKGCDIVGLRLRKHASVKAIIEQVGHAPVFRAKNRRPERLLVFVKTKPSVVLQPLTHK